ncbi:hypothetical protein [Vandammella animalimorsus]|uniref:Uncharacterized protein n=1 Tax=Vandammella animalimorsus TaxID=2029117 RepID=A0A2A2AWA1_9BURK|nr:hypothetical protein [Vandammella animalimorsus]PAT41994.1 hypothetical protein CK621_11790 [Vandammella animalimorsus]RRD44816.1 hypothetical protein EII18_00240 [Comamonadaceae bacterium OH3737_COT-264]
MRSMPATEREQALRWLLATRRPGLSIEQAVRLLCQVLSPDHATLQTLQRIAREQEAKESAESKCPFNWRKSAGLPPYDWLSGR